MGGASDEGKGVSVAKHVRARASEGGVMCSRRNVYARNGVGWVSSASAERPGREPMVGYHCVFFYSRSDIGREVIAVTKRGMCAGNTCRVYILYAL